MGIVRAPSWRAYGAADKSAARSYRAADESAARRSVIPSRLTFPQTYDTRELSLKSTARDTYRWLRHRLKTENAKLHSYYHAHSPLLSFLL